MLVTARRLYRDGALQADLGVRVDGAGRVQEIAHLSAMGAPTDVFGSHVLLPPAAHACILSDLEAAFDVPDACAGLAGRMAAVLAAAASRTDADVTLRLTAALRRAARRGVGTVGLLVPADHHGVSAGHPWPLLNAALDASVAVGLRTALIFALRPPPAAAPGWLERGYAQLDAGVRAIMARQNDRLSWAVMLLSPAQWADDDLVSIRLRLGHLPLLVPSEGPIVARLQAARGLDACVAILATAPPSEDEAYGVGTSGALWLQIEGARPRRTSSRTSTSRSDLLLRETWAHQAALAMRGGTLAPGRWADWLLAPWAGDDLTAYAFGNADVPRGARLFVAGRPLPISL